MVAVSLRNKHHESLQHISAFRPRSMFRSCIPAVHLNGPSSFMLKESQTAQESGQAAAQHRNTTTCRAWYHSYIAELSSWRSTHLRGGHAGPHKQLGHVVQVGRVGLGRIAQRQQLRLAPVPHRRGQRVLARGHPVQVALQRVDLACARARESAIIVSSVAMQDPAWQARCASTISHARMLHHKVARVCAAAYWLCSDAATHDDKDAASGRSRL